MCLRSLLILVATEVAMGTGSWFAAGEDENRFFFSACLEPRGYEGSARLILFYRRGHWISERLNTVYILSMIWRWMRMELQWLK